MFNHRRLLLTIILCSALAVGSACAQAQAQLTQILDTITNLDGTPFNGTVVISWNGSSSSGTATVSPVTSSTPVYSGALSVLLVPTTTAPAGTYYVVAYHSSNALVTWSEIWQVPPSATPLTVSQVRQSSTQGSGGSTGGGTGTQYATLPIQISQVTDLGTSLGTLNTSVASLTSQITALTQQVNSGASLSALQTQVNNLQTTVTGLGSSVTGITTSIGTLTTNLSTLTSTVGDNGTSLTNLQTQVNGLGMSVAGFSTSVTGNTASIGTLTTNLGTLTTTVGGQGQSIDTLTASVSNFTSSLNTLEGLVNAFSAGGSNAVFVDAETPAPVTTDSTGAGFTLTKAPSPAASLSLYRNGILQVNNVNFILAGTTVTFQSGNIPQSGDLLEAYYRASGTSPSIAIFVDGEIPGGSINGNNLTYTLAVAPSPANSLKLYKNGVLLSPVSDFTLSGSTITFVSAAVPQTGDTLQASYRH